MEAIETIVQVEIMPFESFLVKSHHKIQIFQNLVNARLENFLDHQSSTDQLYCIPK